MGDTFIERIYSLEQEFVEVGKRFSGLRLDLLKDQVNRPITLKGWNAFIRHNGGERSGEKKWEILPGQRFLALFHGNVEGYEEFLKLAIKAYRLFCETDPTLDPHDSYHGWLAMIYRIAHNCPTPDVNYESKCWGYDATKKYDRRTICALSGEKKQERFPVHPEQLRFKRCIFQTAASVLQMFYAPHRTTFFCDAPPHNPPVPLLRPLRLVPWQLCAVMCNNVSLAENTTEEIANSGIRDAIMTMYYLSDRLLGPRFVEDPSGGGKLMLGGQMVRKVNAKAKFLILILRKLESQGWPPWITIEPDLAHQARGFPAQMKSGQKGPRGIDFTAPKSGMRIAWSVVDVIEPPSQQSGGEQQDG